MILNKKITKKISFLLIVSILSLNLSFLAIPQRAHATWPSFDYGNLAGSIGRWISDNWKTFAKEIAAQIARAAAKRMMLAVTASTVDWINKGGLDGQAGQPAYIADFNKFMTGEGGVLDSAIGDFIEGSELGFLCDPFKLQVSLALQIGVGSSNFVNKIGCTLSGVNRNINRAINTAGVSIDLSTTSAPLGTLVSVDGRAVTEFERSGGWYGWLNDNLSPQNNPVGAYLIAKAELDARLSEKVESNKAEISQGGGSLSFKECYDIYRDASGNQVGNRSQTYTVGVGAGRDSRPSVPRGLTAIQNCEVKTPGSAITAMLGFKATQDQRVNELSVVMSDGIDAIIGAAMNYYINKGLNQLKKGVLHNDTAANTAEQNALAGRISSLSGQYSNAVAQAGAGQAMATNYPGLPSITMPPPIDIPIEPSTTTTSTTTNNTGTGSGFGGAFDQARNNSIVLINSLSRSESEYQNNYLIAQNVLISGRDVFASSSVCNVNYNRTSSILRSIMIRNNVLTNIDGTPNSDRTIASIPWNLPAINAALAISNANMTTLSTAASAVNSASNIDAITTAMIPVNSTNFNTDPQSTLVTNIKTWLTGVQGMYNSTICPINLTSVMSINSPANSGN